MVDTEKKIAHVWSILKKTVLRGGFLCLYLFETEDEIDGSDEEEAGYEMVPAEGHMERQGGEEDEDHEGDDLLNDLQLHEGEGSAVALKAHPVGRDLEAVLKESDAPREENHEDQGRGVGEETHVLELEVAVPRERHKHVRR